MRMKKQMKNLVKNLSILMTGALMLAQLPATYLYATESTVVKDSKVVASESVEVTEVQLNENQETTATTTRYLANAGNSLMTIPETNTYTSIKISGTSEIYDSQDDEEYEEEEENEEKEENEEEDENTILVNQIVLNTTKVTLAKNASIQLVATVSPQDAEDNTVMWSSSDEEIAMVSEDGIVTAVDAGTAEIYATASDGSDVTATCTITILNNKSYKIKYNLNKGVNAPTNPTYYASGTKVKLANPTRKNYIFTGWYKGEEKVTYISKETTGNVTLAAKWEKAKLDKTIVKSAKNTKAGQITVAFEKLSGASGYTVYYSTDKKMSNGSTLDISPKKNSATINGLVKGTTYYITVKAYIVDSQENRIYGKSDQIVKVKIKK